MSVFHYGSLFAGAGLLDCGLHSQLPSLNCLWAVELHARRRAIFGAHFPHAQLYCDVGALPLESLLPVAGLVGGVPCNTHSTANTAGQRALAPQWQHVKQIIRHTKPAWTLWESSGRANSWRTWVPSVRGDLHELGHASMPVYLSTGARGAPHERERAFVLSWSAASDAHQHGQPARALHAEASCMRAASACVWDGRPGACEDIRLDDGADRELATAIGYGVDQRTARDIGSLLGVLLDELA